jgi:hypothetical protein
MFEAEISDLLRNNIPKALGWKRKELTGSIFLPLKKPQYWNKLELNCNSK